MVEAHADTPAGKVFVESSGAGADLVLIHGWGTHGGVWHDVADAFAVHRRVHVVDLPGHGYSRPLPAPVTLDAVTDAVDAALRMRGINSGVVIGWSLGGLVAMKLALRTPELVKRLVTVATSPCFVQSADWPWGMAPETLQQFHEQLKSDYQGTLLRFLALQARGADDARRDIRHLREMLFVRHRPDPGALEAGLQILADTDLRESLNALRIPVLIVGGQHDALVPAAALHAFSDLFPDARVALIERAAHAPFVSHPRQFLEYLESFLR
ncbi:MAG: pimeloyl-ACP methyl ester esterase BioH [Pseudomonadota bacterium]|nr:MAG: pimeloyl-ACP methyl ester esterase BioH [Pseudomonadota bacterium]